MVKKFKVKIENIGRGINQEFYADGAVSILDAAEQESIFLPYLCRTGDCYSCVAKLEIGSVAHVNQNVLTEAELVEGYILTCSAFINSDCAIVSHKEKEFALARKRSQK